MGRIRSHVLEGYSRLYPSETELLAPFLSCFDVTWGSRRRAYNTDLSVYFLQPDKMAQDQFGFDTEVMLILSSYPTLQSRTMQAAEQFLNDEPARGRVDQAFFFVITRDANAIHWTNDYTSRNPQSRIPVMFLWNDLVANATDDWQVRKIISGQLFSRDLFDYQLPLNNDLFFFGRDSIVAEFSDAIKRSENRGLFGLRKTGKTSVLFKVKRLVERESTSVLYLDCKSPAIRSLDWRSLLAKLSSEIQALSAQLSRRSSRVSPVGDAHPSEVFAQAVRNMPGKANICIIFDEVEFISPIARLDTHWHKDFVPFWQTLWTTQSETRRLSFIVAGVNPSVIEQDTVDGVQNPMFGIVRPQYLRGFEANEMRSMIRYFGQRMGISFSNDAMDYLHGRYGGHPLLTRMACSSVNRTLLAAKVKRPILVGRQELIFGEVERENEIAFYSRHVVSELRQFYPVEYELLETLASGNQAEFLEFSVEPDLIRHLSDYGLVDSTIKSQPRFRIPVIAKFVAGERARRLGQRINQYVLPSTRRQPWLNGRLNSIVQDLKSLERIVRTNGLVTLYGEHGVPETNRLLSLSPVEDLNGFENFINVCNRCFVEPLESQGKKAKKTEYFWEDVKAGYPTLWAALHRIKVYRHHNFHLSLNDKTEQRSQEFLEIDLQGKRLTQVDEPYFLLQQAVIDELFIAVQCELDNHG